MVNYIGLCDAEKEAFIKAYAISIESILILNIRQEEILKIDVLDLLPAGLPEIHDYVIFDKQNLLEDCKSLYARILSECGYSMQEYDWLLLQKRIYQKCYNYIMPALLHIRVPVYTEPRFINGNKS